MQNIQNLPNLLNRTIQTKPSKPNLSNRTYQIEPTKPNLPNQTYHTKPTKPNLSNQTYQTKGPALPKLSATNLAKPNFTNKGETLNTTTCHAKRIQTEWLFLKKENNQNLPEKFP